MSAAASFAPSGTALISGKGAGTVPAGAIHHPPDLCYRVYGDRIDLCLQPLTTDGDAGLIVVLIDVPARALARNALRGVRVVQSTDELGRFMVGELHVDVARAQLRGMKVPCIYAPGYRAAFELDLEPAMVGPVLAALRACNTIARLQLSSTPGEG